MKIKPNVNHVATNVTLYFCPVCKKGHLIEKNQEKCEICGTQFNWKGIK